jgi:hypothetical protein
MLSLRFLACSFCGRGVVVFFDGDDVTLKWTAMVPKRAGYYWTVPKERVGEVVPCVREVLRHREHGMVVLTEPGSMAFSMNLVAWATNHGIRFAGPIDGPPEV